MLAKTSAFLIWAAVAGTAVFWAAILAQLLVIVLYNILTISYLWYNLIGCAVCVALSLGLQIMLRGDARPVSAGGTPRS